MIQRKQSLYLLAALILLISSFLTPLATLIGSDGSSFIVSLKALYNIEIESIAGNIFKSAQIISILIAVLLIITIFAYRKRLVQIKLCSYSILLLILQTVLITFALFFAKTSLNYLVSYNITIIFPLISAVMVYLASKSIKKDEELVRSLDRLR